MDKIKVSNARKFLQEGQFLQQAAAFKNSCGINTGYGNIDQNMNLYPGLYVLGAVSSLGKTTFCHQMADQIATSGHEVVYFSLEQSTLELTSKSLARAVFRANCSQQMTSLQIRKNPDDPRVKAAIEAYAPAAEHMTIVECSFSATIKDLEEFIFHFVEDTGKVPIIFIDYLQVLKPEDPRMDAKTAVDTNIYRLKQLQELYKAVVIAISSFNRQNYLSQTDFESFKESGGIEYTADVVWGLQLQVLHDPKFVSEKDISEKRRLVQEAKATSPRRIELVCLKNRFGQLSDFEFSYFPSIDLYQPIDSALEKFIPAPDEVNKIFGKIGLK